jgi:hypothetical protein
MNIIITLTQAGIDTGPFDIYTDHDGYSTPIDTNISRGDLLSGYLISVPASSTIVRVLSNNLICNNSIDINIDGVTTTTTTTSEPTTTTTTTSEPTTTTTTTSEPTTTTTTTTTILEPCCKEYEINVDPGHIGPLVIVYTDCTSGETYSKIFDQVDQLPSVICSCDLPFETQGNANFNINNTGNCTYSTCFNYDIEVFATASVHFQPCYNSFTHSISAVPGDILNVCSSIEPLGFNDFGQPVEIGEFGMTYSVSSNDCSCDCPQ